MNDLEHAFNTYGDSLLIVEDDEVLRDRPSQAMTRRGFSVTTAASVADGLAALEASRPRFAIIDLRLLERSGLAVIESLRRVGPACRTVVLKGYGNIPTAVAAARTGAVDYIAKSATADEIVDVLRKTRTGG